MGETVYFTPFHRLRHADHAYRRNSHGAGVRILDKGGLEDELSEVIEKQMDTRSATDRSEYPRVEWDMLLGFTTYGSESDDFDADYHNVSNTNVYSLVNDEFERVSQYTEPFVTMLWRREPHAVKIADGDEVRVYCAVCFDGESYLRTITFDVDEIEVTN